MAPGTRCWSVVARVLLACWISVAAGTGVHAQEKSDEPAPLIRVPKLGVKPLAVVNLSSIDRAREKLRALFEIAGHPETIEEIMTRIEEQTNGLAGVDLTRPAGVAMFLDQLIPPRFEFVAFAPLSDVDAFMQTLELGPVIASQVAGEAGRYELIGPTTTSQVRVENGYAFIQLPIMEPDEAFERNLPEPTALLKGLTTQFDFSVTLDVDSVPPPTRALVVNFITSTMSTQMQQRDGEADGLYEMRRAWMQADIDGFKVLLDECQRITVGVAVEPEERVTRVDFVVDVREGSELLNEILQSATRPSYFAPILDDDAAISLSMSQMLPDRDRERYVGLLDGMKKELARQVDINDLGPALDQGSPVLAALNSLQETFQEGHLDAFGQCYSDSQGKLVVVGALRVLGGEVIARGLEDMLHRIEGRDGLEALEIGVGEHAGLQFHRIGFSGTDVGRSAVLGENSGFVFACGPRSVWFGLGGEETLDTVASVMDQLQLAYEQPTQQYPSATVRFIINAARLIEIIEAARSAERVPRVTAAAEDDAGNAEVQQPQPATPRSTPRGGGGFRGGDRDSRRERFRERQGARVAIWRETLLEGGDRVRMEFHPTKHGSRFRLEFEEAFLKGLGRAIAVSVSDDDT